MKKLIAFDLDDTLSLTKSPITDNMARLLAELIRSRQVCIISGGWLPQFKKQVLDNLHIEHHYLQNLHLMPTCGTRYYKYDDIEKDWKLIYQNDIPDADKQNIVDALTDAAKQTGHLHSKPYGELVQDRYSQVTFSALGQEAPATEKHSWDPDTTKRREIVAIAQEKITDYEVRIGGATSIDVTLLGVDKAYGMEKLMAELEISKDEILFIGDKLEENGNDYPVKAMGIDTIAVRSEQDTEYVIEGILGVIE